jgi:long-chain acyl-CoA synthetase
MENRILAPNLAELYKRAANRYESLPAFATRHGELDWNPVSFRELYERGLDLATGLIELGVEAREHVGLFGDNRYEWILADYGVQLCGAADVPRGGDVTDDEMIYIINHANVKVAFVESEKLQEKILRLRNQMPVLEEIILLDPKSKAEEGIHKLEDVVETGANKRKEGDLRADNRIADIRPDDLFTLIYTSGTTGKPKGVMLTHANMMSQMKVIPIRLDCTDRVLSILPIWHIFERVFEMYTVSCGVCTYYTSIRTLGDDLKNVEPTFMGSAPRLWENLHERILKRIAQAHPMRRLLFKIAYFLGKQYKESVYHLKGNNLKLKPSSEIIRLVTLPLHLLRWLVVVPWYGFFNAAVLEPIRLSAGGSLKATISGGGALPVEIDKFFNYIGIPVLEGYGMTETSPVLAVRLQEQLVVGTVGPPVYNTELRLVDIETQKIIYPDKIDPENGRGKRGEIWVRGPQVMKGYYKDPERTEKTIQNGWLRTGDLGMITFNDCLKILGRSKATIVLLSGENLEPEPIEMRLNQSPYITNSMLVGQDQKHVGALIEPNLDEFAKNGISVNSLAELSENEKANQLIRNEIKSIISTANGFKRHEQIQHFRLLPEPFEVGEELTNLYKLKRHVIQDKYDELINEMYSPEPVKAGKA